VWCRHGWGADSQGRATRIDGTEAIPLVLPRQRPARQGTPAACQRGPTLTACGVEPLAVGCLEAPVALRAPSERVGSMTILLSWLCWGACQEEVCLAPRCLCNLTLPRLSVENICRTVSSVLT